MSTGRALSKRRAHLHKTGDPSLLRMVALEYIKTFDENKVAEKFSIKPQTVIKILARPDIQEYVKTRMIPLETLAETGARRLLEAALQTAFDPDVEWKERTENRKLLAKSLLPEFKKIQVEHRHVVLAPKRFDDADEWARKFQTAPPVIEAEILEDE